MRIIMDRDDDAYAALLVPAMMTGECVGIAEGERVFGYVESLFGGILRIRRKGDAVEYFAPRPLFERTEMRR